jgi:hypothetical protein
VVFLAPDPLLYFSISLLVLLLFFIFNNKPGKESDMKGSTGAKRNEWLGEDDVFMHKIVQSEEQRRRDHPHLKWTPGQYRWFEATNVIDLWCRYCADEKAAICERLRSH